jgi:isopentenyl diphosphate isomerase/L-lactate dehydrogenase-like FMN-dependent dehydrogenase
MASSPPDESDRDAAPADDLRTINQVIQRARAILPAGAWDYARAGAGEEVTVRRNRSAWQRLAFAPSVLRDVSDVDTSTRVLGVDLAVPVMCSPVGSLTVFHPDGATAAAAGAASMGTVAVVGILSSPTFAEVQSASDGRNLFQIYASGDEVWLDAVVDRVTEAGARGLCVTVDSPVRARRDRLLEGSFDWRLEQEGVPPNLEGLGRDRNHQLRLTWRDLQRLRSRSDLPIAVKGIMGAADAERAVDVGMDAIYVSNHGGRELDHAPSTIEVLDEVVGAVDGRAEVVLDSGIRHGSDVCKAIALGARAVLIGRLQCWALAAGGAEGVAQVLRILRAEIADTMALVGVTRLDQLTRAHVRATGPT